MAHTRDMTQGSPTRLILGFCLPIVAGNLFQQFYSLVDTLVIGRVEGVTALAAVSSAGWLDWLVLSIAMGMAQGFGIQIAQSFGAKDEPELRRAAGQGLLLSVAVVALIGALSQWLLRPTLVLMRSPENTIDLTCLYLRIIFGGLPLVMAYNLFSGYLRAIGDSRTPLIAMTTAAICNILLDILFVATFRWSVVGVASATVLSQGVSCLICLGALLRLPLMRLRRSDLRPDRPMMRRLITLGLPLAFQNLIISVGGLVLQGVVNGFGFLFMAGFNAAMRLTGLIELAGTSIGSAVGTFAGQNLGAGRIDRVKLGLRKSAQIAAVMALVVAASMLLFGRNILALFVQDDPEIIGQVLTIGYRYLAVMSFGLPMLYMLFVYRSTLQGLGDTVAPMVSGIIELVMRMGTVLLLPLVIGEWGVYIAEIMAWIGAAVMLIISCYRRIRILDSSLSH
ncbi:MAG: MATE family efflux transporter [Christensenellaceae bacterium]|nr:MATE family efflux transporter [Christensenellaceae bacterium]